MTHSEKNYHGNETRYILSLDLEIA